MNEHLLFFDSNCPLCQKSVQQIQERDAKKQFVYLPLTSTKAHELLSKDLLKGDTLVLVENTGKIWIRSKAVFRILKLLGGRWAWLGFLCHVPGLDLIYRLIAHNRHLLKK